VPCCRQTPAEQMKMEEDAAKWADGMAGIRESVSHVRLVIASARERLCFANDPTNTLTPTDKKVMAIVLDQVLIGTKEAVKEIQSHVVECEEFWRKPGFPMPEGELLANAYEEIRSMGATISAEVEKLQKELIDFYKTLDG
jgi:hypothetical protein